MNIGWLVFSMIRTAVRRLCGQVSEAPTDVEAQSNRRVKSPISPPPARKAPELTPSFSNIDGQVLLGSPSGGVTPMTPHTGSQSAQNALSLPLVPIIFLRM